MRRLRIEGMVQPELICVGQKYARSGLKKRAGADSPTADTVWNSMHNAAEDAFTNVQEVLKILQGSGNGSELIQLFRTKKRTILKEVINKLTRTLNRLNEFRNQAMSYKDIAKCLQEKLKTSEGAHLELYQRMDTLSSNMQVTLKQLQEEKATKDVILNELQGARKEAVDILKQARAKEVEGSELLNIQLRVENEKLKADIGLASQKHQIDANAIKVAETRMSVALEQIERYKEVVAKITADNMVFLLKLKHSEEELETAHRQQTELKKQVEVQQGNWLEEASAEIEDAVKSSLIRAEACESQVQMVQKQQEGFVREWQEKLETTTFNLSCITAAKEKLEERVHTMENERVSLVQRVDSETSKRQELEAEIRILLNNVKKSTNEFAEKQSRYLSALEEIKVIKRDLQLQEEDINNLVVDLQDSCSQLETQRAINSSLMRKKEEMEWQCLEAQAEREKLRKQLKGLIGN